MATKKSFSTLYRVDAIEAMRGRYSISVMACFSTLYRVDAIEAHKTFGAAVRETHVSVPSIGSMLLKLSGYGSSTYPMYVGFSTLYRVDAIEAFLGATVLAVVERFQYPLSGRCY